jgi:predicted small lipoprotein YifL
LKDIAKLAAVFLLLFAFCGCGKKETLVTDADDATIGCANCLAHIDAAKKSWAEQHNAALTDTPTADDLDPYFRHGMPVCPKNGTYTIGTVADLPQCSIAAHNDYFRSHLAAPPAQAPATVP